MNKIYYPIIPKLGAVIMSPEELVEILRRRVSEFGEKPAYMLFPEELSLGKQHSLFLLQAPEDRGDGTLITKAVFEGKNFLCVVRKD
ncbi:MAG: hypothetical protein WAV46_01270 [Candidatus Moraniibacteriota bacterium]